MVSPRAKILFGVLPALFIGLTFGLGRIVRDCSLTCNGGYELSPLALLAIGLIPVIVMIDRFHRRELSLNLKKRRDDQHPTMESYHSMIRFKTAWRWITGDDRLKRMAVVITLRGASETVLLYLFYWLVTTQTAPTSGRSLFFADFYVLLNGATLLFLLAGTNRLINRFGLIAALASFPAAMLIGTAYLAIQTMMAVTYILRIVESALERSLYLQSVDRMILEVDESRSPGIRPILQGLSVRLGRIPAAILILGLSLGLHVSIGVMIAFNPAILSAWLWATLALHSFPSAQP